MAIKGIGIDICSSRINGRLALLERDLAYYADCGFEYVEIPVHGVDAIFAGRLLEPRMRRAKEILAQFELRYTVHAPDLVNLFDVERLPVHKAVLRSTLIFARQIGAEVVVYHAGAVNFLNEDLGLGEERLKEIEREALIEIADETADWGVSIAVENGRLDSYSSHLPALVEQVRAIGRPNVGITFDFGHAFLSACWRGFDLYQATRLAAPHVIHIHAHDNFGVAMDVPSGMPYIDQAPLGVGDLHMPPGWGAVPYQELLTGLETPPAVFLLELHPRWMDVAPQALEMARRLAALMG
nr:sugar phosphate isomerase/epimerase [Anaerolineae bacterium]